MPRLPEMPPRVCNTQSRRLLAGTAATQQMMDGTTIRAYRCAAGAKGGRTA